MAAALAGGPVDGRKARHATLTGTVSLMHNNLACSPGGWLASTHNVQNAGSGKLLFHCLSKGCSQDGQAVTRVTSIRYLQLEFGTVLCVHTVNGTQIYGEDGTTMLFFADLVDNGGDAGQLKCHQGSCVVPSAQHIVIGTSKGSLMLVHAAGSDRFTPLPESFPSTQSGPVADVCYSAACNSLVSATTTGDLVWWMPSPSGPYSMNGALPGQGEVPVRLHSLGPRLLVALGSGAVRLYDANSREMQIEVSAHARCLTSCDVLEAIGDRQVFATVGEDTILNVWQMVGDDVALAHSSSVTDKLLTGVAFHAGGCAVVAYDTEELFYVNM